MGMFDSLYIKCPKCNHKLEFQSKSGECALSVYRKDNLDTDVAIGLDGDIVRCQYCNKRIKIKCNIPKKAKVKLTITNGLKFDYEGNHNPKHPYSIKQIKKLDKLFVKEQKSQGEGQ